MERVGVLGRGRWVVFSVVREACGMRAGSVRGVWGVWGVWAHAPAVVFAHAMLIAVSGRFSVSPDRFASFCDKTARRCPYF